MRKHLSTLVLLYLRFFARLQIRKLKFLNPKLKIIGVTGSAGKTSTILAIETVLKPHLRLKAISGYNSESGIPLGILGLNIKEYTPINWAILLVLAVLALIANWQIYDILIIEMGIDSIKPPKNMDYLLPIVQPDIGILLNVSSVHLVNFPSLKAIATEKAKLINNLPKTGYAIINPVLKPYIQTSAKVIEIKQLKTPKHLPVIYGQTLGAAAVVAKIFKIKPDFTNFLPPPGRCRLFKGINHSTIIDSSYNSSPVAAMEMLKFLKTFPHPRVAVLGDMRELGNETENAHRQIYRLARKTADLVIGIGPNTQKFFNPPTFLYWWQAVNFPLPDRAAILVKGSQNTIYLEELVKAWLQDKSDQQFLCRQSPYWQKIKANFKQTIKQSN